jgi:hypothetical protein
MSDPQQPAGTYAPRYRPTEAISYGWRKFKEHPSALVVPMIVALIVLVIVGLFFQFVVAGGFFGKTECSTAVNAAGQPTRDCGQPFWRQLLGAGLGAALISLFAQIMLAGIYRGALRLIDGEDFGLGQLFEGYSKAHVIFASIFISVATGIATILCYLPGVLIAFLTSFTLFFIVDQEMEAAEAIAASVKMVWHHFGIVLVFFILAAICLALGFIALVIGLLVAAPVVVIAAAYTYRRLEDLPVNP